MKIATLINKFSKGFLSKKEAKYVKENGSFCPFCDSKNIEGTSSEIMDNGIEVEVECLDCHKSWTDYYKLAGIVRS
jgi:hypothetical protein